MIPFYIWLIAGIMLGITEMFLPTSFVLMAFAGGCVAGAFASMVGDLAIQLAAFSAGSLLCFFAFRKVLHPPGTPGKERFGTEALKGQRATVLETVNLDQGYVQVGGERWPARAQVAREEFLPGSAVKVREVSGNKVIVVPLEE